MTIEAVAPTSGSAAALRRVVFSGAEVIEYDADQAPVVKLCGGAGAVDASALALECQARGLADSTANTAKTLTLQYVEELRSFLRERGFEPMSDDLRELQTQRRVVELLLLWASGADPDALEVEQVEQDKENQSSLKTLDVLNPATLRHAQLAKKQLEGLVDDGYAFGRRFMSVAAYVDTLESHELLLVAKERGLEPPTLDEKQRAAVKALDRELLGLYGTAEGRPLRSLTLRQLVTEAEARGFMGPGGEKARDSKGKKSKRAWVDLLRPVMVAEVRASKIREQEEELLRLKLVAELEREKQREQHQRVLQIIETMVKQGDSSVGGECAEPEDDDGLEDNQDTTTKQSKHSPDEARKYLEALAKCVCIPSEAQEEDVVMRE